MWVASKHIYFATISPLLFLLLVWEVMLLSWQSTCANCHILCVANVDEIIYFPLCKRWFVVVGAPLSVLSTRTLVLFMSDYGNSARVLAFPSAEIWIGYIQSLPRWMDLEALYIRSCRSCRSLYRWGEPYDDWVSRHPLQILWLCRYFVPSPSCTKNKSFRRFWTAWSNLEFTAKADPSCLLPVLICPTIRIISYDFDFWISFSVFDSR